MERSDQEYAPREPRWSHAEQRFLSETRNGRVRTIGREPTRERHHRSASAGQVRVNGLVVNLPEFEKAFACKPGQPMVKETAVAYGDGLLQANEVVARNLNAMHTQRRLPQLSGSYPETGLQGSMAISRSQL